MDRDNSGSIDYAEFECMMAERMVRCRVCCSVCCSMLQYVAVCCRVLQFNGMKVERMGCS